MAEWIENDGMRYLNEFLIGVQPNLPSLGGDYAFICHDLLSNLHQFEKIEDMSYEELLMISDLLNLVDPRDDPLASVVEDTKLPWKVCPLDDRQFWTIRDAIKKGIEDEELQ